MKHIKLFENFKESHITCDDIISCIKNSGYIYSDIVKDYPEIDSSLPIKPTSVDEYGNITVDIEGRDYEVKLENVNKITF